MEKDLNELVAKLKVALGDNLKSIILFGSAATDEFHKDFSDVNVACVLDSVDSKSLKCLQPVALWWTKRSYPIPLILSKMELQRSADVFAIEYLDMKSAHRLLHGEDVLSGLEIPMTQHRLQVERELRTNVLRLRLGYLSSGDNPKAILALLADSISSFATLFRHALLVMGEPVPPNKLAAIERLAQKLHFDVSPFRTILEMREGKQTIAKSDYPKLFAEYLQAVEHVTNEVDRQWGS